MDREKPARLKDEIGFFVTVPESLIERAAEIGTDGLALWVYLRYRLHRDRKEAWPGYLRIAQDLGWGNSRISNAIQALEPHFIDRRRRFGQTTIYRLKYIPPDVGGTATESSSPPELGELEAASPPGAGELEPLSPPELGGRYSRNGRPVLPEREGILDLVNPRPSESETEATTTTAGSNRADEQTFDPTLQKAADFAKIIRTWESSVGPITAGIAEDLGDLCEEVRNHIANLPEGAAGKGISAEDWTINAIEEARASSDSRRPNLRFVQAILDRWRTEGFRSPFKGQKTSKTAAASWLEQRRGQ